MTDKELTIIPIHPEAKYCIQLPKGTSHKDAMIVLESIDKWWKSSDPFMVLDGSVKLIRVDKEKQSLQEWVNERRRILGKR